MLIYDHIMLMYVLPVCIKYLHSLQTEQLASAVTS